MTFFNGDWSSGDFLPFLQQRPHVWVQEWGWAHSPLVVVWGALCSPSPKKPTPRNPHHKTKTKKPLLFALSPSRFLVLHPPLKHVWENETL